MYLEDKDYKTICCTADDRVHIIDQNYLPHKLVKCELTTLCDSVDAIKSMQVRGAPLIGITASAGMALAMLKDQSDKSLFQAYDKLIEARPTAVNLSWALNNMCSMLAQKPPSSRKSSAFKHLIRMIEEDVLICRSIGEIGVSLITDIARKKIDGEPVNILTHCNAGWLAAVDWGTALSPIYLAHKLGCNIHVWVSETRPRNQGSSLTSWELSSKGVSHTIIVDNAAGHLMKNGMIDMCIVGADRVTNSGDVCNKIGTYMKALSAFDNNIPFYVATPFSSIDWSISDGFSEISIEKRSDDEVLKITGLSDDGKILHVNLAPKLSHAVNYGFDITPAKLVCGLITQFGIFEASRSGLNKCLRAGKEIDQ